MKEYIVTAIGDIRTVGHIKAENKADAKRIAEKQYDAFKGVKLNIENDDPELLENPLVEYYIKMYGYRVKEKWKNENNWDT